jgi:chaperone modulatory protein CbpM
MRSDDLSENDLLIGSLLDDTWLSIEQVAIACTVEPEWLVYRIEEGFFPEAQSVAGVWRFSGGCLLRARRIRQIERDFDAVPELAALVADMLDEMDALRARLRRFSHEPLPYVK